MKKAGSTDWDLLNLGVPSETASGLSEPVHPFPRPCVHERLDSTLAKTKPNVVIACYGMNDAIYYPFDEENLTAFINGIQELADSVVAIDAQFILLTPPPFENAAVKEFGPDGKGEYSWMHPSQDYDNVMRIYSEKLIELFGDQHMVLDTHTSLAKWVADNLKEGEALTKDGVHFEKIAHKALAQWLFGNLFDTDSDNVQISDEIWRASINRMTVRRNAWLQHCGWNRRDMPKGLSIEEAEKRAAEFKAKICQ